MGHTDVQAELDQIFTIICISQFLSIQGSPARTMLLTNLCMTPCLWGRRLYFWYCRYRKPTPIAIKAAFPTPGQQFWVMGRWSQLHQWVSWEHRVAGKGHPWPCCCACIRGEQKLWAQHSGLHKHSLCLSQTSSPENLCSDFQILLGLAWSSLLSKLQKIRYHRISGKGPYTEE